MAHSEVPLLACRGLTKRFGRLAASDGVDLDLYPGRVHALLGENGAGKSTLMSMLSGRYQPDAGRILHMGRAVRLASPAQAIRLGIGMLSQRFMLVERLTVAENLALALGGRPSIRHAQEMSEKFGLAIPVSRRIDELSMGERQRVEVLRLLARDARVLILDEPTSVLGPAEIDGLYAMLRRLADQGRAVVFITHRLQEVARAADEVSVLRRGRMQARSVPAAGGLDVAGLARLMMGHEPVQEQMRPAAEPGPRVLAARGLCGCEAWGGNAFFDVDLTLRRGEILAVTGVAGNGQEALAAVLGGLSQATAGSMDVLGRSVGGAAWQSLRSLVAFVPADRHGTATVPDMSLADNFLLTTEPGRRLIPDRRAAEDAVASFLRRFSIAAPGPQARAGRLSGGNLQKFILARELWRGAPLLVAEQPTQGLDVAAVDEVRRALAEAAGRGTAILLFTGDPEEALGLGHRVAAMYRGRVAGYVDPAAPGAKESLGRLMAGLEAA